ncbi:MAG: addiction module antidote protein, HigA family [Acetobacteraceae bacterium]|nr:addiction module antidote protein, HigA family [Acetobacteraceae bacterium]
MSRKRKSMHPGRILREEYMEPLHLDANGLAAALGVHAGRLEPIIADQEPVTSDLALRLAKCFRTSPQFWLGLQTAYDLSMAEALFGAEIDAHVHALAA